MDVQILASILLAARLIAVTFLLLVLRRQWILFRYKVDAGLNAFRKVMFGFTLVLLFSNFMPVVIDIAALITDISKGTPSLIGVTYAFSNAFTSMISAIFIWTIYRIAGSTAGKLDGPQ